MNASAAVTTSDTLALEAVVEVVEVDEVVDVSVWFGWFEGFDPFAGADAVVVPPAEAPLPPGAAFAVYSAPKRSADPAAKDAIIFLFRRDDLR
ncbi:hypothetical protein [Streptomyces sp. NPDC005538]|uniref:hypothetical protein n=1 Tax=unclassified Streptomyces TaxID=2593676 RepID=UPI0033A68244